MEARQGNLADVSAKDGSQGTLLLVFANLKAVKAVTMETLNRARYMIILKQFASTKSVASVKEVN
ncbi:hypothetical protein DAPPUDRAFT_274207 [Daphnia pulex]|uniref:Uncharacterized protein n=1 Tax=Daphnia pulex TaxID=6669 RepID=E9I3Z4_DAPPU|nr:hypothetical protein DAPPUDRAFT_274207 [Daphnia pulex]|eukprot:EFX61286.1 hypothetical protein DAPPUDRAFT_274207 [Daphnia pulex]